jgi:hypothetical protein
MIGYLKYLLLSLHHLNIIMKKMIKGEVFSIINLREELKVLVLLKIQFLILNRREKGKELED